MIGAGAAAATDQVDPSFLAKTPQDFGHRFRRFDIVAVFVGKAGVRNAADRYFSQLGHRPYVVGHKIGAGGAVESNVKEIPMAQAGDECFRSLAAEHGAHGLNGTRYGHGYFEADFIEQLANTDQCGLDVAGIL